MKYRDQSIKSKLNFFKNKNVLITGHTGFKGTWLSYFLTILGAKVSGISIGPPTKVSHYKYIKNIFNKDIHLNILDEIKLRKFIMKLQPDLIFHLAAQPLVSESIKNPLMTWKTNLIGSLNIINSSSLLKKAAIIMITSDKCYFNNEWLWGYKETDMLGGKDPYSASKASTEIAIRSFVETYKFKNIKISTARAGNVIGGGDWALNRIIPDCIRAWNNNKKVTLRSPNSTRPWQHVLEPLFGYLLLAKYTYNMKNENQLESFNFGPNLENEIQVIEVVKELEKYFGKNLYRIHNTKNIIESRLLKLNCEKAKSLLNWKPYLDFDKTISLTANWYKDFYSNKKIHKITENQIIDYISLLLDNK